MFNRFIPISKRKSNTDLEISIKLINFYGFMDDYFSYKFSFTFFVWMPKNKENQNNISSHSTNNKHKCMFELTHTDNKES